MKAPWKYHKGHLTFDNIPIQTIAQKAKTPFYLYSERQIGERYSDFFNAALNQAIPDPLVCFALKSNPNPLLLKRLAKLGAGADIVSGGELRQALKCGIPPQKIVFSGVGKTIDEMRQGLKAGSKGIYSFNVESIEELEALNKVAASLKKKARFALRLNPQVKSLTHKHISTGHKTHKFGLLKSDILKILKKDFKHCQLVGLSIHIGSQLKCLKATAKAIKELCLLAHEIKTPLEFLDVGGGLGVDYSPEDQKDFKGPNEYMDVVYKTLTKYFKEKLPDRIVFEPGRVISARSGLLITKVIRQKCSEGHRFIIVDGGMNDFVRTGLYGAYHEVFRGYLRKGTKRNVDIVGPICESADCFASGRKLGPVKNEDLIAIADVGAYGYSMASHYNMRELPQEWIITEKGNLKKSGPN
jgi:diaminopimelate decarboxylase